MENEVLTSMPRIGDKAPSFKAKMTQGEINFPEDYSIDWPANCRQFQCSAAC